MQSVLKLSVLLWVTGWLSGCCAVAGCNGSSSHPKAGYVQTENIQWDMNNADDQELVDQV